MNSLFKKSISMTFTLVYATGAILLVSPNIVQAAFSCAADNSMYTDKATCDAACKVPLTCSAGAYAVTGNSTLYNNPFNKIVWGTDVNTTGSGFPDTVKALPWIDFQNAGLSSSTGTSGGKLSFGFTGDSVQFTNAPAPATNEIFSGYRPVVGVSTTAGSLEFLMVNTNTGLTEVAGSIPTNGKITVTGGTHKDTTTGTYTQITRVATDTNKKTMMMYGILPTGNETTIAEVVIEPGGTPLCPVLYNPSNPSELYTCDANNSG